MRAGSVRIQAFAPPGRELDEDRRLLSIDERRRADAIRSPTARARYVTTHAQLRRLLAAELECRPRDVPLHTPRSGPPEIGDCDLRASISHTDGRVVLAVSPTTEIGVDVERLDRTPLPPEEAWLSTEERRRFEPLSGSHRHRALVQTWTAKEAVAKALGSGLATPLRAIDVDRDVARGPGGMVWRLYLIDVGPRHVATLALPMDHLDR